MNGVDLKPRSATMTDLKVAVPTANGGPKKRSRDNMNKANTSMTSNPPPKSPKRASSKHHQQQQHMTHASSAPNLPLMQMRYASGGGLMLGGSEEEAEMIAMLENIDWTIPTPPRISPAASPFTDSAASLSSGSGHISYKNILHKCNHTSSPLQFSHIDQVNVSEELTDSDMIFDVFDELCHNMDLKTGGAVVSTGAVNVIPDQKESIIVPLPAVYTQQPALSQEQQKLLPVASPTFQPPVVVQEARKEPRVWFSSSVIGELKTKTNPVQPGFSIGHGILKPWRDRKPVSQLPPLRTLTSNTPPVVIPTQSLTLLDSTFCNYPPALYQNDTMLDMQGTGYVSDSTTLTSGESSNSNSNSAYCIGTSVALSLDSPSQCSEDVLGSPKTFSSVGSTGQGLGMLSLGRPEFSLSLGTAPQSPAVKKRGRPRKNSLTSTGSNGGGSGGSTGGSAGNGATIKSRSCSNLSASNAPIILPPTTAVAPMVPIPGGYLASYPSFPALGTTAGLSPPSLKDSRSRKNSLTSQSTGDLLLHHPYDDFMMSCRGVDPTNSFAHQLSHEHDPNYVMPVSSGMGGVGMMGGSVLGSESMFDHHFHGDSTEMDCSMSFGFDELELQTDAAAVGKAAAAANLSRQNSVSAAAPPSAGASVSLSTIVKQEEEEDLYAMLSAGFE